MASKKSKLTEKTVSSKSSEKSDRSEDSINSIDEISSMYKKMSQRDHVLNLPDTYIGSIEESEIESWVYDKTEGKMVKKMIRMIPGLYKIFDEILVNAIDQYERLSKIPDAAQVREIHVEVYPEYISVMNDGDGIDVEIHPEHDVYVPELIFGNLLTSANYEKKNKTTGGRNGIGAKATNIFSKRFIIETVDGKRKRHFRQEFMDNMSRKTEPVIEKYTKKPYTKITFYPDFERFNIEKLNDDMEALFMKRVYDITAITDKSVSVYLNGTKIEFKDFEQYVDLYIGSKSEMKRVYEKMGDRWEVVVCDSPDDKLEHVSFVNGVYTWKGGKHVEALTTAISTKLSKYVEGDRKSVV